MRLIFHLDIDSYFVSAHQTINPNLKNKPIVISHQKKRGIILSASYEAKKMGIEAPMPLFKVQKKVPNLIIVKPNYALYTTLSTKFFEILSNRITKNIEIASIDECYMDVTDVWEKYGSPLKLAKYIQKLILKELKLPISIGISHNKFIAKMSTNLNKPLGITITKPGDFNATFGDFDIRKIHGIGQSSEKKLRDVGINKIKNIIDFEESKLAQILGASGNALWENVHEIGDHTINKIRNELQEVGNSITFMDGNKIERQDILMILKELCRSVFLRLKNRNLAGKVISVAIKETQDKLNSGKRKQKTLDRYVNEFENIFRESIIIFDELWNEKEIKYISVSVRKLSKISEISQQISIFDKKIQPSKIKNIIHDINSNLKKDSLKTLGDADNNKKQNQSRFIKEDKKIKK